MRNYVKCKDLPYRRVELETIEEAFSTFLKNVADAKTAEDFMSARKAYLEVMVDYSTNYALAEARYSLDSRNEFYMAEQEYYDNISPTVNGFSSEYAKIMLTTPYRSELEKVLPETIFKSYEYQIKCHSKETEEDEREENLLTTEYSKLRSQLTVNWRGEIKPTTYVSGFMEEDDRETRREAAFALGEVYNGVKDKFDQLFDKLVKVRTRMARKLGFKNFVEMGYYRMNRLDYNKEMVEKFRYNVLKDIVPVVGEIKAKISENCGFDKFYYYDNTVIDCAAPKPFPDEQGILRAATEMYHDMNPEIGAFMDKMIATEAFDVTARDGKFGGGYCTCFAKFKQPFVFANFNGSSGDVDVVTHEFGHALAANYLCEYDDPDIDLPSMEVAETHSMSMEFFAWKYIDKFFKDPLAYKYKHLEGSMSFIPYGVIVDEFQHIVYENPDMTPEQRNQAYLELESKYRPYLTYEGIPFFEEGRRWQIQSHIYENPFYYIDYCLAQVIALEFLVESQKDYQKALSVYIAHLKRSGHHGFSSLVNLAGLKSPFEEGALTTVFNDVLNIMHGLMPDKQ